MARPSLVLDASVGVKWFSPKDEGALGQALTIRDAHIARKITIMVPDLFYYEVTNALVNKRFFTDDMVRSAASALFQLDLRTIFIDPGILSEATVISRRFNITIYDSCYIAIACKHGCPLVTANPRHQRQDLDCRVIPVEKWMQG
ncbi:MAG: type II toxin-antitoxin system VapC family toxin [Dehalococcoidales bacterium]|jgi:predicted nucleic acid-binding protein|nr:type II toxin-antitoxin system VapC family toxin [Dehalococcoidales bacterium]